MLACRGGMRLLIFSAAVLSGGPAAAEEAHLLREDFAVGNRYRISTRVELEGVLKLPAAEPGGETRRLDVKGKSDIEYDERILAVQQAGGVDRMLRIYRRLDFQRQAGDQKTVSRLRPAVCRMVLLRLKHAEVPFSPDGPLTWSEIDQVRTDVFTPALAGLLPQGKAAKGDRWRAQATAVAELTDLEDISEGGLECTFARVFQQDGRSFAQVNFKGTVLGVNADGPNQQRLEGYLYFDLKSRHLSYLSLQGTSLLLDKAGKEIGRLEGRFVLSRNVDPDSPELTNAAIRGLALEPNADNTLLLFDEPTLGVRFLYPRRWMVSRADGRQIVLEAAGGSGILITLEPPQQTPTVQQFQMEIENWLKKKGVRDIRWEKVKRLQDGAHEVERFGVEVELDRQPLFLDYYIARQETGGATIAGRYPAKATEELRPETERIARSLRLQPPKR